MKIKNFMIVFVSVLGVLYGLNSHWNMLLLRNKFFLTNMCFYCNMKKKKGSLYGTDLEKNWKNLNRSKSSLWLNQISLLFWSHFLEKAHNSGRLVGQGSEKFIAASLLLLWSSSFETFAIMNWIIHVLHNAFLEKCPRHIYALRSSNTNINLMNGILENDLCTS